MGIHKNPPQPGEMEQMTESCMTSPVVPAAAVANGLDKHGVFPAARRGGRLVQMAEFSARMRCFKGAYEGEDWRPLGISHCHSYGNSQKVP